MDWTNDQRQMVMAKLTAKIILSTISAVEAFGRLPGSDQGKVIATAMP